MHLRAAYHRGIEPIPPSAFTRLTALKRITQKEMNMPTTPSKGHQNHSGASDKATKANLAGPSKPSGSTPDLSRTSQHAQGTKQQESHKSGEHRRP